MYFRVIPLLSLKTWSIMGFLLFVLAFTKLFPTVRDSTEWTSWNWVDIFLMHIFLYTCHKIYGTGALCILYDCIKYKYVRCFRFFAWHVCTVSICNSQHYGKIAHCDLWFINYCMSMLCWSSEKFVFMWTGKNALYVLLSERFLHYSHQVMSKKNHIVKALWLAAFVQ